MLLRSAAPNQFSRSYGFVAQGFSNALEVKREVTGGTGRQEVGRLGALRGSVRGWAAACAPWQCELAESLRRSCIATTAHELRPPDQGGLAPVWSVHSIWMV